MAAVEAAPVDTSSRGPVDVRFRQMGCRARLVGPPGSEAAVERARGLLAHLEACWSRFLATSEVTRLNAHAGRPVRVSPPTQLLVQRSLEAQHHTDGLVDTTLLGELVALGYDRTHQELPAPTHLTPAPPRAPADRAGMRCRRRQQLEVGDGWAMVEAGSGFDPGGVGKGLAADFVAEALIDDGVEWAVVDLGGDVRVVGSSPWGATWPVVVGDPFVADRARTVMHVAHGAIATSNRTRRRWAGPTDDHHHLLDPLTGRPAHTDVVAATVHAPETWWAESLAKAAVIGGSDHARALLARHRARAVLVRWDGSDLIVDPTEIAA